MLPTTSLSAVFIFSFILGIGAVVSPGPVSTAIVSQASQRGWLAGPLVASGHAMLELLLVGLITAGSAAMLAHPDIRTAIALLGGALLAFMGLTMIWNTLWGKTHLPGYDQASRSMNSGQLVGLGILATMTNPFWYAWWVTVATGYLAQAKALGLAAVLLFFLGHISADYIWDTLLSTVVGGGRRWISDRVYQGIILVCGGFFVYLAWIFMTQGLQSLV